MTVRKKIVCWIVRCVIGLLVVIPWALAATLYFKNDDLKRFLRYERKERSVMMDTAKRMRELSNDCAAYENKWRNLRRAFGAEGERVWDALHLVTRTNEICSSEMEFESLPLCELCYAAMRHRMSEGFGNDGEEIVGQKDRPHFRRWRDNKGSVYDLFLSTNGVNILRFEVHRPGKDR